MNVWDSLVNYSRRAMRRNASLFVSHVATLIGEPLFYFLGRRWQSKKANFFEAERVCVLRLDEIGDVVMTTPFLRELRRYLPHAWITLIVKPTVFNLVELCPYVNEVLTFDWRVLGRARRVRQFWRALQFASRQLWQRRFDLAIIPRWDVDFHCAAFTAYFSGARWRVGYSEKVNDRKHHANRGFDGMFTHVLVDLTLKHEVERNLSVIRYLFGEIAGNDLELWVGGEDNTYAAHILKHNGEQDDRLIVVFGVGAGASKRMWSIANYTELAVWLVEVYRARVLVLAGPGEESLGECLRQCTGNVVTNLAGKTTLRQAVALLMGCQLYVGNDSGQMHLTAAVGIPVVEISCHPKSGDVLHENSPKRFGPWGVQSIILQPSEPRMPCVDCCIADRPHCILGVTVEQAKSAVSELLQHYKGQRVLGGIGGGHHNV